MEETKLITGDLYFYKEQEVLFLFSMKPNFAFCQHNTTGEHIWAFTSRLLPPVAPILVLPQSNVAATSVISTISNAAILNPNVLHRVDWRQEIIRDYKNGMSGPEVTAKHKSSVPTVYRFLKPMIEPEIHY